LVDGAEVAYVIVFTLDVDVVSVHEELLDDIEIATNVVTVSVSSTVV
jgi:hypothetical protein